MGLCGFFEVANVDRLEKELDQIFIGNKKLYVNIPKYIRVDLASGPFTEVRSSRIHETIKNKNIN